MNRPTLYIFAGLPGSGKSTIAQELAKVTKAVYLRIDTVEQGLRDLCGLNVGGEGYRLSYRIAADNLKLGSSVIADACNPVELTRTEWNAVAEHEGAGFVNIEVICSDKTEHRHRVETRKGTVAGLKLPTWEQVETREYHRWQCERLVVDTAGKSPAECVKEILEYTAGRQTPDTGVGEADDRGTFSHTKSFDNKQLENLFRSVGWGFNKESFRLKEALAASDFVVSAWDGDTLIGLANALTDNGNVVYIHYFLVHGDHQGSGVGKKMMQSIKGKYQNFRHMILIASNDKTGFFKTCGFDACEGATAMEIRRKRL